MLSSAPSLRSWVADHRPRRSRHGYPDHVRREVLRHVRPLRDAGRSLASLADEVGLPAPTLGRWLAGEKRDDQPGFVPVLVHDASLAEATRSPGLGTLTLVTPAGYRVEGLDVDGLRALLPVLG